MKQLILLLTTLIVVFNGISQTHSPPISTPGIFLTTGYQVFSDSVTISKQSAIKAIQLIEKGKIDLKILQASRELIDMQKQHIEDQDTTIRMMQLKVFDYERLVYNFQETIKTYQEQNDLLNNNIKTLQKDLHKEKKKSTFSKIAAALISGAAITFALTR